MISLAKAGGLATGALVSGVIFAVIWSLSFVVTKSALADVAPLWLASIRLALAAAVLWFIKGRPILRFLAKIPSGSLWRVVTSGILAQGVYLGTSYWALIHVPTSVVNIVVSTLPLVTLPLACFALAERIGLGDVAAFVLGVFGVAVTLDGGTGITMHPLASAALLLSVVALALGNILVKPIISPQSLLPICATQFLFGTLVTAIAAWIVEPDQVPRPDDLAAAGAELAFLSLIGSIASTFLWFHVLRTMPANAASSFFLLTPVIGIIFGALIFAEPVTQAKLIGIGLISTAILLRLKHIPLHSRSNPRASHRDIGRDAK